METAREWADEQLEELEEWLDMEYARAARSTHGEIADALDGYERERAAREKALDGTREAKDGYKGWLASQAAGGDWKRGLLETLVVAAVVTNAAATEKSNGILPTVYAESANMAAYEIDMKMGRYTSFDLVNEDALRYVLGLGEYGQLIHEVVDIGPLAYDPRDAERLLQSFRKTDSAKDILWNRQKFNSAIAQGIMKGESVPNIVKRTDSVFGANKAAATRAVRTACTAAMNAGRLSAAQRYEEMGISVIMKWEATPDDRTRPSHRDADGQERKPGEMFDVGAARLEYPGDPGGGDESWNCRCDMGLYPSGYQNVRERWTRLKDGTTYEEWKAGKPKSVSELKGDDGRWLIPERTVGPEWGG